MDKQQGKKRKKRFVQAICSKLKRSRISRKIKKYEHSVQTVEGLVAFVCRDLSLDIIDSKRSPVSVVQDLFEYTKVNFKKYPQRCRLLLFELLDFAASYKIQERHLIRNAVNMLGILSRRIDREIFFLDSVYYSHESLTSENEGFISKRDYILTQLAGWKVPWMVNSIQQSPYFLDKAVLSKDHRSQDIHRFILLEAIYNLQDSSFVLKLLQQGVYPVALYLYPIFSEINNIQNILPRFRFRPISYQMTIIRYFCRAKRHFVIQEVPSFINIEVNLDEITKYCLSRSLGNEMYKHELYVTPSSKKLVPLDRYLYPACLKHLCRLAIRQSLLEADKLPLGIHTLPIPSTLLDYVDLNQD